MHFLYCLSVSGSLYDWLFFWSTWHRPPGQKLKCALFADDKQNVRHKMCVCVSYSLGSRPAGGRIEVWRMLQAIIFLLLFYPNPWQYGHFNESTDKRLHNREEINCIKHTLCVINLCVIRPFHRLLVYDVIKQLWCNMMWTCSIINIIVCSIVTGCNVLITICSMINYFIEHEKTQRLIWQMLEMHGSIVPVMRSTSAVCFFQLDWPCPVSGRPTSDIIHSVPITHTFPNGTTEARLFCH